MTMRDNVRQVGSSMRPPASSPATAERMSRQGSRDTSQELAVRSLLHRWGLRFRVNDKVPGMPRRTADIMFRGPRVAVFLDGCFWHCCPVHGTSPSANAEWWQSKLGRNVTRDRETNEHLAAEGWTVLRFWEHESVEEIATKIRDAVREAQESRTVRAGRGRRGAGTALRPPPPAD